MDIALASSLIYHASIGAYNTAIVIAGDRDFLPAFDTVEMLGKKVKLASFKNSCSQELVDYFPDLIWIDDYLSELLF